DEAAATDEPDTDCYVAEKVLLDIRKAVSNALGLNMEELAGLIEQLGITMADLANVQQLTQLTLASANEPDIAVLLTDGDLSAKLHGLLEQVQGILDEAGMTPEKLSELIPEEEFAQLAERMPAMQTETGTSVGREVDVRNTGREAVQETGEGNEPEPEESTFHFEAVRETRGGQVGARREGPEHRDTQSGAGTQTQAEQFLNLVTNAAERTDAEVSFAGMDVASQVREIADQILERVRVIVSPARTSMEITLTPESLGKVNLNVVSQHGVMTARFTAQTEIARQAIESQLVTLRENLEKQGLKVDAIEVTVSEFGFSQSDQAAGGQSQEGRRQNRRGLVTEEAEAVEGVQTPESMPAGIAESGGSRVDYTA
ncbi:MAG: flagellar hook-length control protein FliK, partial [Lachnospiraceae bacterium]|nr:flagellar hook-length control protein FliK [Lachnospiraceae bacterium]